MALDVYSGVDSVQLLAPIAVTVTANTTGVDFSNHTGIGRVDATVGVVSGTTPTMSLQLQDATTAGATYANVASAAALTVATTGGTIQSISFNIDQTRQFLRIAITEAGTTPSFLIGINVIGTKKYMV
jgi:hypothetical protein